MGLRHTIIISIDSPGKSIVRTFEHGTFYTTSIATLASGYTYATFSEEVDVRDCDSVTLQGFCTCASSATGTTDFEIFAGVNSIWDNIVNPFITFSIIQPGTGIGGTGGTPAARTLLFDVSGVEFLRVGYITNTPGGGATSHATVTLVNVNYSKKPIDSYA